MRKKIISTTLSGFLDDNKEKTFKVIDRHTIIKDLLYVGSYDECVEFILQNRNLFLDLLPVENDITSDNFIIENNLAIIGSRSFNNYTYAKKEILNIIQDNKIPVSKIISGGASGTDKIAEKFANNLNIPIKVILPDWSLGKHAGLVRNTSIIENSDYIIAFWDGESKGTLDSINKAKKLNKKIFIIKITPEYINEGVRINNDDTYLFDFNIDNSGDILSLKYNKEYITRKKTDGVISYYSYKINKTIDKNDRFKLLNFIKKDLVDSNNYEMFLNKAVIGLFNNPHINVSDADLILIPESSSNINFDLANKIKNKIPNVLFFKDIILKNEPENVFIDTILLKNKNYKQETIIEIQNMVKKATINGKFKIKKITPRFRSYILNFLKIDVTNRRLLNKLVNGKVIIVDDITTAGTTFKEINRLIENYAPKEILFFSLIG